MVSLTGRCFSALVSFPMVFRVGEKRGEIRVAFADTPLFGFTSLPRIPIS
jgi:hypothetical protein